MCTVDVRRVYSFQTANTANDYDTTISKAYCELVQQCHEQFNNFQIIEITFII